MRIRNDLMALAALAALGICACSGGGVSSSGLPQGQPSSSSGATSQTVTRTYTLASDAGSYDLAPLGGFSGSLALPAATVPANTRLELTSSFQAPADAPILQGANDRPQAAGTLYVYFYTTIRLSSTVAFPTLPGFSVTLPATVNAAGLQFFYAISNPKPTNGAEVQFRTEGPATVSGQIVTFAPSTTPLTLLAGQPYTIAFYAISAIAAKPTLAAKIYVTAAGFGVKTYALNGAPTTPTITTGLSGFGIAVDAVGKIYVTNGNNTVTTYMSNGMPTTPTITTGLSGPVGIAVDAAGKIYVANESNNTVTTYTQNGVQTTPTITGLFAPKGVALDAAGKIYVASGDDNGATVTTYTPNGSQTTPTINLTANCGLGAGIAVDLSGKIYVTSQCNSLTTYNKAGVQTAPTITAGLEVPVAVAVDSSGKIYVVNTGFLGSISNVTTYTANGTPTTPTITPTGLFPLGIAVR